ncbi:peptidoglycan-associated lipoprotein [Paracoccus suum]|uniref:Peptidoglycan-associated lipoprotein n=2 Tax=Paracoccus suum TaxID=2259340 RepID=A0A344PIC9_9RHOB|nr:peptidoglycan-associated lipoprotein [Paracoccus suum]
MMAGLTLAVAGCTPPPATVSAPVTDPYVNTGDAGARYTGDVTRKTRGVLPGTASPEAFAASAGDSVSFSVDQVILSPEGRAQVGRQAAWLSRNKSFIALIEGHADEQGTREYNLALGARRAASVQEYMIAQGIEPGRVSTVSYGNERPLSACNDGDEACSARNRRAVTVVSPGAPAAAAVATLPGATPPAVPDVPPDVPDVGV